MTQSTGQTCRRDAGRDAGDSPHTYLQRFEDDHGGARRTRGVVIQQLLQLVLQAAEVGGRAEGLGAPVLDGAEGLWETGKLLEALQQQPVHRLGRLVWRQTQMERLSVVTIGRQRDVSRRAVLALQCIWSHMQQQEAAAKHSVSLFTAQQRHFFFWAYLFPHCKFHLVPSRRTSFKNERVSIKVFHITQKSVF